MKILLADDHALFAESMELFLQSSKNWSVVDAVRSGRALLDSPPFAECKLGITRRQNAGYQWIGLRI